MRAIEGVNCLERNALILNMIHDDIARRKSAWHDRRHPGDLHGSSIGALLQTELVVTAAARQAQNIRLRSIATIKISGQPRGEWNGRNEGRKNVPRTSQLDIKKGR
jgi:hypothetical protein